MDQIWLSPPLAPKLTSAFIERRTKAGGDGTDHDPHGSCSSSKAPPRPRLHRTRAQRNRCNRQQLVVGPVVDGSRSLTLPRLCFRQPGTFVCNAPRRFATYRRSRYAHSRLSEGSGERATLITRKAFSCPGSETSAKAVGVSPSCSTS
jgi:hypothetical protein